MEKDYKKKAIIGLYKVIKESIKMCLKDISDEYKTYDSIDQFSKNSEWLTLVDEYIDYDIRQYLKNKLDDYFEDIALLKYTLEYGGKLLEIISNNKEETPFGTEHVDDWVVVYNKIINELEKAFGGKIKLWVNVYRITRHYGGAEEGGWWYNKCACIDSHEVLFEDVVAVKEKMKEKYGEGEGDIYSVLGGHQIEVRIEDLRAENESIEKPVYC